MTKVVVLAGGKSESLFPVTRDSMPKEFKKFGSHNVFVPMESEKNVLSTFQRTVLLVKDFGDVIVVTKKPYRFTVTHQLAEIGVNAEVIFDEDIGAKNYRDVLEKITEKFSGEKVAFFNSDQIIYDVDKFKKTVEKALGETGIVTIGTPVTEFDPHAGYIRVENGVVMDYKVAPNVDEIDVDSWLIHTGIIIADRPGVSIMGANAIVGLYKWKEINSYRELENVKRTEGVFNVNSSESYVYSETNSKYALVGVNNIGVIDTGDVIVVFDKRAAPNGKELYNLFKDSGLEEIAEFGRTVYKPWGRYTNIFEGTTFKVKLLEILPGKSISLQKHFHRSEHWVVVSGTASIRIGDDEKIVRPGESAFVPVGTVHMVSNPGKVTLKIIEVQYGEYLGEDDIVRIDDPYHRDKGEVI